MIEGQWVRVATATIEGGQDRGAECVRDTTATIEGGRAMSKESMQYAGSIHAICKDGGEGRKAQSMVQSTVQSIAHSPGFVVPPSISTVGVDLSFPFMVMVVPFPTLDCG